MSISIVIPTYSEEKFIGVLLQSLVEQTYKDFEVIVSDGDSPDKTKEVVLKFEDKLNIRFLVSPKKGVSFQRNYGASQARYDYLMFIDADGYVKPDFLSKTATYLKKNPNTDLFSTWVLPMSKNRAYTAMFYLCNTLFLESLKKIRPFVSIGGFIFIKKSVFNELGGYSTKHAFLEDVDLAARAFKNKYKVDFLRKPIVYTSIRRLEKEGLPKLLITAVKAHFYQNTIGEVTEELMKNKNIKYEMKGGAYYDDE